MGEHLETLDLKLAQAPRHFHVDIETLGVEVGSTIVEIGVCEEGDENGVVLLTQDIRDKGELVATLDTLQFHGTRRVHDWYAMGGPSGGALSAHHMLLSLADYFHRRQFNNRDIIWMRRPAFDQAHLTHMATAQVIPLPWKFYQVRDHYTYVQTVEDLLGVAVISDDRIGPTTHRADEDAVQQAITRKHSSDRLREMVKA